ncbi:thioredoxin-like protein [Haematococcus lacustris]
MTEYHTIYRGLPGDTTQWGDIQRKLGNLPQRAPVWKPAKWTPEADDPQGAALIDSKDAGELSDLDDQFSDDRFLEEYRQRRVQELRTAACRPRFGSVELIRASEFVQKGPLWVVVQLFKDGHGPSALMSSCIDELAARYPNTKFVRIISTECIPKYPDAHLPTLLVYHAGECVKHLVGLAMHGGNRATPEQVALVLNQLGSVCSSSADGEEGEEEGCGTGVRIRGPGDRAEDAHLMRQLVKRVVAAQEEGSDEDSDFD